MSNVSPFTPKPATDHKWRQVTAEEGKMAFEHHSAQEQRIKDLESGKAIATPEEDAAIRKVFMKEMGIKDAGAMTDAATKDNDRIQKKLDNKNKF